MYSRVYVEITNQCNLHCSFCHGHSRAPRRMTEDEFERVLDALCGLSERPRYLYFHLMGEPLTHPLLPRFLHMGAERGFLPVVTTNGTLLAKRGEELLASPLRKISVSLHSLEAGGEEAVIRYLSEVAEFGERAAARGMIVVLRLWNRGCDGGQNAIMLAFLRKRLAGEWVETTKGIRIRDKLHIEWGDRFVWPDAEAKDGGAEVFCYGLRDHFGILADGTVVPCCLDSEGTLPLGNVFQNDLSAILSCDRAEAMRQGFRNRLAVESLCRRCGYAKRFQK